MKIPNGLTHQQATDINASINASAELIAKGAIEGRYRFLCHG